MSSKKKRRNRKRNFRMLFLGVSSVAIIIVLTVTIGRYWISIFDKYEEKRELEVKLVNLKNEEQKLKLDANKLQDPDYIARYAREKYLYSKDGEFIIRIPEKE